MAKGDGEDMGPERKRKIAADCFKKGTEAMMKANWDYAISMLRQSTKLFPDNLLYRQTLRGCQKKKYKDNGTGAPMSGMWLMGTRGKIKKARFSKNWAEVEEQAEEGMKTNPWDGQFNFDLGEAALALGWDEVALYGFEMAATAEPKNKEYNKALALLLEERGEYERAIACWERIAEVDKLDGEARSKLTSLRAKMTMDRGGYEGAGSTRDVSKTGKNAPADGPGMSVEADLERELRKNPANKDAYLKLADIHRRKGALEKAEELLKKALEVSGGDVNIREQMEDVQLDRMKQVAHSAKEDSRKDAKNEALKTRASELYTEFVRREMEVLAQRVERYPANMAYKLSLGKRNFQFKKFDRAIPLFQQSRADNRLKGESLVLLGLCFMHDKEFKLARRQFEEAKPEIKFDERPDLFKELNYSLGDVCEKLGDTEAAIRAFQDVLAVDYNFRDTKARLVALEGK